MSLIDDIQAAYPTPKVSRPENTSCKDDSHCYCVGGAILLSHGYDRRRDNRFPDEQTLAFALEDITGKYEEDCRDWALAIVDANDAGDFTKAWAVAARALASIQRA